MMKRSFTKLMAAFALFVFMVPALNAMGDTYSYTFTSNAWTANGSATLNNVSWTLNMDGGAISNFSNDQGMHFGTNNNTCNSVSISTTGISGNITNVTVEASRGSSLVGTLEISVGGTAFYIGNATTNALTTSNASYEYTGSGSGQINILWTKASGKGAYYIKKITVTYTTSTDVPSITASDVDIAYDATEGFIDYTIDNPVEGGVLSAETDADWISYISVGAQVHFTCYDNAGMERTATITLTYTYNTNETVTKIVTVTQAGNPNAPGTENNPYTVAQARAAIDAGTGTQGVYATGIVSQIVTAYDSGYGNITFDMVDAVGDNDFLRAYRCGGDEAANVQVGDIVVVSGNLIYYTSQSLYEFAQYL